MEDEELIENLLRKTSNGKKVAKTKSRANRHRNSFIRGKFKPLKDLVKKSIQKPQNDHSCPPEKEYDVVINHVPHFEHLIYYSNEINLKVAEIVHFEPKISSFLDYLNLCPLNINQNSIKLGNNLLSLDNQILEDIYTKIGLFKTFEHHGFSNTCTFQEVTSHFMDLMKTMSSNHCENISNKIDTVLQSISIPTEELLDSDPIIADVLSDNLDFDIIKIEAQQVSTLNKIVELENFTHKRETMLKCVTPNPNTDFFNLLRAYIECS